MAEFIFWLIIGANLYTYLGYPAFTFLLSVFVRNRVDKGDEEPRVTFLITAYIEEKSIAGKLENTLALNYPGEKLEIIVASDGSSDRTDSIVKTFEGRGVILCRVEGRVGKTETQNQALKRATGAIVIFSDATTAYGKDAIRMIVRNYHRVAARASNGVASSVAAAARVEVRRKRCSGPMGRILHSEATGRVPLRSSFVNYVKP